MRALKCKRVARVISLYVAGDLVGEPERDVAAHLASCESCRRLAEEFSESNRLLTQACAPPEFGAEFYAGIRHAVLSEITRDRIRSKPSLFRPRWIYATAFAAAVIVSGVMLQHFVSTRRELPRDLARAPQVTGQPASPPEVPLPLKDELPRKRSAQSGNVQARANLRGRSGQFETVTRPDSLVAAQAARVGGPQIAALQSSTSIGPAVALEASSQVSRIEIQTADPNIRIIWLSARESGEPDGTKHDQDHPETSNRK